MWGRWSSNCIISKSLVFIVLTFIFMYNSLAADLQDGLDSNYDADQLSNLEEGPTVPFLQGDLSISGVKFHDLDGNGFLDEGELGLSDWTINLLQDNEVISSTTTDSEGHYSFENLYPGSYVVAEVQKDGWVQTAPVSGSYEITLTDTDGQRYDFGNYEGDIASLPLRRDYPAMRPTPEERHRWIEEYDLSPMAELDSEIPVILGSYSLLNQIEYTPSERNQGACGNCWVWAGTSVMEVALNSQESIKDRLSIQYLNSNYDGGSGINWACCGGWLADLAYFYSNTGKAIPWSNTNAHWQDGGRTCGSGSTSVPAGAISTNPYYTISSIDVVRATERGLSKEENIAYIKNVLNQGKAVSFGFFIPNNQEWSGFTNFWSTGTEDGSVWDPSFLPGTAWVEYEGVGHAVLCVGYDDSDPNNRYWIMLNSWGAPSNRPNGLFRMEMDMDYDCYFYDPSDGNNYYSFYWQTLDMSYDAMSSGDFRIVAGSTTPGDTNWVQLGSNSLYVDVDTSSAGFTEMPLYFTSLGGKTSHWIAIGVNSVYKATPTGFRIYIYSGDERPLTPEYANENEWHIQWLGMITASVGDSNIVAGSTTAGDTSWVQLGGNSLYLDVDTSSAGFTETPLYFTSLGGKSSHWIAIGSNSVYKATPTGFRIYIYSGDGRPLTPEYANENEWYIKWSGIKV